MIPEYLRDLSYDDYIKERQSTPLNHSDSLGWDPRDHFQPLSPMPTDWRGVAKAAIFLAVIAGIAVAVGW